MKLIISNTLGPDGVSVAIANQLKEGGVHVHRLHHKAPYLGDYDLKDIDECHVHHFTHSGIFGGIIPQIISAGVPVIYHCHSTVMQEMEFENIVGEMRLMQLAGQEEMFNCADKVLFFSDMQKDYAVSKYPEIAKKSEVFNYSFDEKLGIGKREDGRVLFVGQLIPEKGVLELAEAMQKVDGKLVVVGEEPYRNGVRSKLESQGVQCLGWLDRKEVMDEYAKASLVVIPSKFESFSMVAMEAAAHGTPILMTNSPHVNPEFIARGEAIGWKPGESLAEAIKKALKR